MDTDELEQARREIAQLRRENALLRRRLDPSNRQVGPTHTPIDATIGERSARYGGQELSFSPTNLSRVAANSTTPEKIKLFRTLFKGREDVYPVLWFNERTGKKGYSPAREDPWNSRSNKPQKYCPLTDDVVHSHLIGDQTIGVYPLLKDDTCWFLACDLDKDGWSLDALAFLQICREREVPAYLERSRSGNGGHVWIFFSAPVPATWVRQLGLRLLKEVTIVRAEVELASYDRFFPNQDFLPRGGFGNLIALPLQKERRASGNTEFLDTTDPELAQWPDQWAFLSEIKRLEPQQVESLLDRIPPVTVGPGRVGAEIAAIRERQPAPAQVNCAIGAGLSVEKSGIPPWLLARIKQLALLYNPQFYEREKLRLSTSRIPRFIKCYEEDASHLHLPRGTLEDLEELARSAGSALSLAERRPVPERLSLKFRGLLLPRQEAAMRAVLRHDIGVLVAPPGGGKTVMGCFAVAERNVPTLILVHRKPILEQWRGQLGDLLGLSPNLIGQVGGGRKQQTGVIDLCMIQSLKRRDDLECFFSGYGLVVIDECHHLPAFTFEACVKRAPTRYILGLTATPYRRDGLQSIITLQCGPVRHTMAPIKPEFSRELIVRDTNCVVSGDEEVSIQAIFRGLVKDEVRNELIESDVCEALAQGRRCLILSHWKEHCELLTDALVRRGKKPFVLSGGQGKKRSSASMESIQELPPDQELLIIATGQYLGEGFDCPQVDTLFLAFPLSFKGKLVQYVGRVLRSYPGKISARVYDYLDSQVPVLGKMYARRQKTYKALGFDSEGTQQIKLDSSEVQQQGLFSVGV